MKHTFTLLAFCLLFAVASKAQVGCGYAHFHGVYTEDELDEMNPYSTPLKDTIETGVNAYFLMEIANYDCMYVTPKKDKFTFKLGFNTLVIPTDSLVNYKYCDPSETGYNALNCNENFMIEYYLIPFTADDKPGEYEVGDYDVTPDYNRQWGRFFIVIVDPLVTGLNTETNKKEVIAVEVYNMLGQLLSTSKDYQTTLPTNQVYIIKSTYSDFSVSTQKTIIQ